MLSTFITFKKMNWLIINNLSNIFNYKIHFLLQFKMFGFFSYFIVYNISIGRPFSYSRKKIIGEVY